MVKKSWRHHPHGVLMTITKLGKAKKMVTGSEKPPTIPPMKILTPPRAPQQPKWPKMGVRVKIWVVFMYDNFLYNI